MKKVIVIKLLFVSLFLFSSSCKKHKNLTTVNFHLYNPVSGEGHAGVKVKVLQDKQTGGGLNIGAKTETIWEGVTDANGKASYSFKAKNGATFFYWQYVENSFTQNPTIKILTQPEFLPLNKQEINQVEYTYTVPASFVSHFKNINCSSTDRFRFRVKRMYNTILFGWTNWSSDQFGCYDNITNHNNSYNDYFICQYEVERNNITNTYLDTFYISPYSVDTFKIHY